MRAFPQRLVTAAMVVAATAAAQSASAQHAAIALDIRDNAGNSTSVLRHTRANVRSILRHAGVDVVSEGAPLYFVNIISADLPSRLGQEEAMGFAPVGVGGRIVYVLDSEITRAVSTCRAAKADILAAVIAHELGHLLLPPNAHARTGLMRPYWDDTDLNQAALGILLFNPFQAKELHKSLTAN
jgi:hypothetical protein